MIHLKLPNNNLNEEIQNIKNLDNSESEESNELSIQNFKRRNKYRY